MLNRVAHNGALPPAYLRATQSICHPSNSLATLPTLNGRLYPTRKLLPGNVSGNCPRASTVLPFTEYLLFDSTPNVCVRYLKTTSAKRSGRLKRPNVGE
jgi:hypothetical protein